MIIAGHIFSFMPLLHSLATEFQYYAGRLCEPGFLFPWRRLLRRTLVPYKQWQPGWENIVSLAPVYNCILQLPAFRPQLCGNTLKTGNPRPRPVKAISTEPLYTNHAVTTGYLPSIYKVSTKYLRSIYPVIKCLVLKNVTGDSIATKNIFKQQHSYKYLYLAKNCNN